jgi:ketosteroid isomerase-like protein
VSSDNVEALREGFAAINSGDLERILAFADADFEAEVPPELSAEPDTYRGHAGLRRYFDSFVAVMDDIRFEAERVWDAGDKLVADVRVTAKGKATGIAVEQRVAQVWTIRDRKALRVRAYPTLSEAFESVGLRE